jgi:hypothetical protein
MTELKFVVSSSDGSLYGPFDTADEAVEFGEENEEELGDWYVTELCSPK